MERSRSYNVSNQLTNSNNKDIFNCVDADIICLQKTNILNYDIKKPFHILQPLSNPLQQPAPTKVELGLPIKRFRPAKPKHPTQRQQNIGSLSQDKIDLLKSTTTLCFWANNPCSLNSQKKDELTARLTALSKKNQPDVMFFTETWFNERSDTIVNGYQLHRTDRNSKGGGVAIYVKNEIVSFNVSLPELNSKNIEQLWITIRYGKESILLGCIYRPHDYDDEYLTNTIEAIKIAKKSLIGLNCATMLLYGDFNFSHTWYEEIDVGGRVATAGHVMDERPGDIRFQSCLEENDLTQVVTFCTYRHSRDVAPKSTLDLIITNKPDQFMELTKGDSLGYTPMGQSHCLIMGRISVAGCPTIERHNKPRCIWSRPNFTASSHFISSQDWITLFFTSLS